MSATHSQPLLTRLLTFKQANASPLISFLPTLSQSLVPVTRSFVKRALLQDLRVLYVTSESNTKHVRNIYGAETEVIETLRTSPDGSSYNRLSVTQTLGEIRSRITSANWTPGKYILVIDSLRYIDADNVAAFVGALASLRPLSVLVTCSTSVPEVDGTYSPGKETLLRYLSTTIISPFEEKTFGAVSLDDEKPMWPLQLSAQRQKDLLLTVEHRRKSGRAVLEECVFNIVSSTVRLYTPPAPSLPPPKEEPSVDDVMAGLTTFNLGMTERERKQKEGVVLPHFSAQDLGGEKDEKGDEGSIWYEPGSEDDYDPEDPDDDLFL
ncbi:hypothetical protein YB2330_002850 [Saitoella coloradoensis]